MSTNGLAIDNGNYKLEASTTGTGSESASTPCCGADNLFKCEYCGVDFFTYKNNMLYCECGTVYDLSGDEPTIVT